METSYHWAHLTRRVKHAPCQIASLSHHPVTLVSTLPVSQLACQVSHDPLLRCCCFVEGIWDSWDETQSHGFQLVCSDEREFAFSPSPALSMGKLGQPVWPKCEFWCRFEEVQQCQRGWMASEHTEHIPEGRRGCDFSRLSQGLGYSVCLGVLMLVLSQCLSNPVQRRHTIFARCEELQPSIIIPVGLFI